MDLLLSAGAYGSEGLLDIAALRIQTAVRAFIARRIVRRMREEKVRLTQFENFQFLFPSAPLTLQRKTAERTAASLVLQAAARGFAGRHAHAVRVHAKSEERQRSQSLLSAAELEEQRTQEAARALEEEALAIRRQLEEQERQSQEEKEAELRRARALDDEKLKLALAAEEEKLRLLREAELERVRAAAQKAAEALARKEAARKARDEEEALRRDQERARLEEKRKKMEDEQRRRKEEESRREEQLMQVRMQQQMRSFLVRAEQQRLLQVRAHVAAARIIQRAWRAFKIRQRLRARAVRRASHTFAGHAAPSRAGPGASPSPHSPRSLVYMPCPDPLQERRRVVAALIIQVPHTFHRICPQLPPPVCLPHYSFPPLSPADWSSMRCLMHSSGGVAS